MTFTIADETTNEVPWFTVFGVGGGGSNAVEYMMKKGMKGVKFVCANTDKQHLNKMSAPNLLQLGAATNGGLGAGADPKIGKQVAEEDEESIRTLLTGTKMLFVTAGMGGGTGTGAAPVVARIAKEMEITTIGVVTMPFATEGGFRMGIAEEGVAELAAHVDSMIVIKNDKLSALYGTLGLFNAFEKANDVLYNAVSGITELVFDDGNMNVDFNDVRRVMSEGGHAIMGIGRSSGENRAIKATEQALYSPLLNDVVLSNAQGIVLNVRGSSNLTIEEFNAVGEMASKISNLDSAKIFIGAAQDEALGDEIAVTVIATGLTLAQDQQQLQPQEVATPELPVVEEESVVSRMRTHTETAQQQIQQQQVQQEVTPTFDVHNYLRNQNNS